jgi:hypothetical protein
MCKLLFGRIKAVNLAPQLADPLVDPVYLGDDIRSYR